MVLYTLTLETPHFTRLGPPWAAFLFSLIHCLPSSLSSLITSLSTRAPGSASFSAKRSFYSPHLHDHPDTRSVHEAVEGWSLGWGGD